VDKERYSEKLVKQREKGKFAGKKAAGRYKGEVSIGGQAVGG